MRIVGVNIPDQKRVLIALTYIYGLGRSLAGRLLSEAQIDHGKRAKDLSFQDVNKIQSLLEKKFKIEGELRQIVRQNISRLKDIKSYRGTRHMRRLPVRG